MSRNFQSQSLASDDSSESRSSSPPHFSDDAAQSIPAARPRTSSSDAPLLTQQSIMRSVSTAFVSSPLNPNVVGNTSSFRSRPPSSLSGFNRIASEDSTALGSGQRGSMILYRLAAGEDGTLLPPRTNTLYGRDSMVSTSDQSIFSLSSDSKYPSGMHAGTRGLVPYAYDPETEISPEDDDFLHEPDSKDKKTGTWWSGRGWLNIGALLLLVIALLALFICYPILSYVHLNNWNRLQASNTRVNSTGQADPFITPSGEFYMPQLIDPDTPNSAKTRTGFDGEQYTLMFSDEFNIDGRTFYPGDDPYWEAVDLWYGVTKDLEWYDPSQITTKGGSLQITIEESTDHLLQYKSGMLQSWNKLCFSSGYIEVSVTFPGPTSLSQGYWPGVWTMGNLGRPGYSATTDGLWPYTYDTCDLGTFPNQTLPDHSGPAAALQVQENGRSQYNNELSWLPGQRLSACTCPGEDHPGPVNTRGRGAPEIDVFEQERNKTAPTNGVVSQSAQFAPFTANYLFLQDTTDEYTIYNPAVTVQNDYHGSAIQQAVSALSAVPDNNFQGSGQVFNSYGFEWWGNKDDRQNGYITWQASGQPTQKLNAAAMAPDTGPLGSQVGQRNIPEEPMALIMNLGMSTSWQPIDLTTMVFPGIMLVDYIRVYQRSSNPNMGCSPDDYPTEDYIQAHLPAYSNPNLTSWRTATDGTNAGAGYSWPKNSAYSGGC